MSPAGVPARLEVSIAQKAFSAPRADALDVIADLAFRLALWRGRRAVGPSGCGKTTLLRIIAGLDRDYEGSGPTAASRHARHGVPGAAAAAVADGRGECPAGGAGRDDADALTALFARARPRPRIARTIPASFRSAWRAAWRWRGPSRSSPICCCSTSRSCRSTLRWRRSLREELVELVARSPVTTLAGDARYRRSHRPCRPAVPPVGEPCRVIGDMPIEIPRAARTPLNVAAIRAETVRMRDQAG